MEVIYSGTDQNFERERVLSSLHAKQHVKLESFDSNSMNKGFG